MTLTAPSYSKVYDGNEVSISDITAPYTKSYSANFIPDFVNSMPLALSLSDSCINAGTYYDVINFTGVVEDDDNYSVIINSGDITIDRVKLSITALDFKVENTGETISERIEAAAILCQYDKSTSTALSLEVLNNILANLEFSMSVADDTNDGTESGSYVQYYLEIRCNDSNAEIIFVDSYGTITIE